MSISIIWIKYHENDIISYPYFAKGLDINKIKYSLYLVGESGKNVCLFVDHIDTFDNMQTIENKPTSYLQEIKDIKEYFNFEDNRCKKILISDLSFMNKIRKTCLAYVDHYEDYEKLSDDDKKLFSDIEVQIFKDRSEMRKNAEEIILSGMRKKATLINIIKNANKEILERDPGDPFIVSFQYKKQAAQEELDRMEKGE